MRGQLLVDMRNAKIEQTKVSVSEYKQWLLSNGMSELQARIIANMMYNEQMAMSVPLVMGLIDPKIIVRQ